MKIDELFSLKTTHCNYFWFNKQRKKTIAKNKQKSLIINSIFHQNIHKKKTHYAHNLWKINSFEIQKLWMLFGFFFRN